MPLKLLFICTHNRCRSILAEAITNHMAQGRIISASAGSSPQSEVHPLSLKFLHARGIATSGLKSQSWDEFEAFNADAILTMCDKAAAEPCPLWFGNEIKVHWGLADPSKDTTDEVATGKAFNNTIDIIERRISMLLAQLESLDAVTRRNGDSSQLKFDSAGLRKLLTNIAIHVN